MSARKRSAIGVIGGLFGFVGMSVVAGLLVTASVTPAVAVTGMAANNSIGVFDGLPEYLKIDPLATVSTMYATQGGKPRPIAKFYSQNRIIDSWDDVSPLVKDAAVSTEDPRFYEHGAIDLQGTLRALVKNSLDSGDVQGGSSITQQYVKNVRLQTCEQYNVIAEPTGKQTQEQAQKAMNDKYQACYDEYTAQTTTRKIQELKLAIGVEKKYSKQEVLLGYLNISPFGGQVYGVESAARYYFGVHASQLNLQQAATLVAIVNNPNYYRIDGQSITPTKTAEVNTAKNGFHPTLVRRNYVLSQMLKNKAISQAQYDAAVKTKIEPKITPQPSGCAQAAVFDAAFYCQSVMYELQHDTSFGATQDDRDALLNHGGLSIYTSLDLDLQNGEQSALSNYIGPTSTALDLGAANVSVELNTGRVVAMVQNRPFNTTNAAAPDKTQVNYADDFVHGGSTGFQTGSTFKAFSLVEWLEEGHALNDIVNAPVNKTSIPQGKFHASCAKPGPDPSQNWNVGNDEPGEGGPMSVLTATQGSVNTAFAVMGEQIDLCKMTQGAEDLGVKVAYPYEQKWIDGGTKLVDATDASGKKIPSYVHDNVSAILGTNAISPLDMAVAYAGIANQGKTCSAVYIDNVTDETGKALTVPQTTCTQAIDPKVANAVVYALHTPLVGNGTGHAANPNDGVPIMGKTGTTDESKQNWLVTSTTKVANATWVGNVQATKIGNTWDNVSFQHLQFKDQPGRNVKFAIAKPILTMLDQRYGGADWPAPDPKFLNGIQVTVPPLDGKSVAEAKSILSGLGFQYDDGGQIDSTQPLGSVGGTNPSGGSQLSKGSAVTVYTSRQNMVSVPDVSNLTVDAAKARISAAGLNPTGGGDGGERITATDPGAGTPVVLGSEVKLASQPGGNGGDGGGDAHNGGDGDSTHGRDGGHKGTP